MKKPPPIRGDKEIEKGSNLDKGKIQKFKKEIFQLKKKIFKIEKGKYSK
jgi:hypothetical protein